MPALQTARKVFICAVAALPMMLKPMSAAAVLLTRAIVALMLSAIMDSARIIDVFTILKSRTNLFVVMLSVVETRLAIPALQIASILKKSAAAELPMKETAVQMQTA
jgi:hypothetical protein